MDTFLIGNIHGIPAGAVQHRQLHGSTGRQIVDPNHHIGAADIVVQQLAARVDTDGSIRTGDAQVALGNSPGIVQLVAAGVVGQHILTLGEGGAAAAKDRLVACVDHFAVSAEEARLSQSKGRIGIRARFVVEKRIILQDCIVIRGRAVIRLYIVIRLRMVDFDISSFCLEVIQIPQFASLQQLVVLDAGVGYVIIADPQGHGFGCQLRLVVGILQDHEIDRLLAIQVLDNTVIGCIKGKAQPGIGDSHTGGGIGIVDDMQDTIIYNTGAQDDQIEGFRLSIGQGGSQHHRLHPLRRSCNYTGIADHSRLTGGPGDGVALIQLTVCNGSRQS